MHAAACHAYPGIPGMPRSRAARCQVPGGSAAPRDSADSADAPAHRAPPSPPRRAPPPAGGRHDRSLRSLMPADTSTADSSEVSGQRPRLRPRAVGCAARSDGGHRGMRRAPRLRQPRPAARPAGGHARTARRGRQRCRPPGQRASSISASLSSASLSVTVDENGTSASLSITSIDLQVSRRTRPRGGDPAAPTKAESPLLGGLPPKMSAAARHAGRRRDRGQHDDERQRQHRRHEQARRPSCASFASAAVARRRRHRRPSCGARPARWSASQPDHTRAAAAAGAVQPARGFGRRQRARVQIAPSRAAGGRAALRLRRRLHALGDHVQIERRRKIADRLDHRGGVRRRAAARPGCGRSSPCAAAGCAAC